MLLTDLTSAFDDKSIGIEYCLKNKWKSIADTHIDTAYEKYCWHLHQYSKHIADTIGSNTNTAILTTLIFLLLLTNYVSMPAVPSQAYCMMLW